MMRVRRLLAAFVTVVAVSAGTAGCTILFNPGPGTGGGGSCLEGTWTLDRLAASPITTPFGTVTLSPASNGVTLTFTGTTWTLAIDQTIAVSVSTPWGSATGTIEVDGQASGTYTSTASTITFTLGSISGTVAYDITVGGRHFTGTLSLPVSGLQKLYGMSGTASYTCTASGLSISLKGMSLHAHH
jgi:hypothetical protein